MKDCRACCPTTVRPATCLLLNPIRTADGINPSRVGSFPCFPRSMALSLLGPIEAIRFRANRQSKSSKDDGETDDPADLETDEPRILLLSRRAATHFERVRKGVEDLSFQALVLQRMNGFVASKILWKLEDGPETVNLGEALTHSRIQDSCEYSDAWRSAISLGWQEHRDLPMLAPSDLMRTHALVVAAISLGGMLACKTSMGVAMARPIPAAGRTCRAS